MPYNRLYYFSSIVYCLKYEGISVHTFVPHLFLSRKCGIPCTVFHLAFVYVTVYFGDVLQEYMYQSFLFLFAMFSTEWTYHSLVN